MSVLVERAAPPTPATTLRTLAGVEARPYARHPAFLAGATILVLSMVLDWDDVSIQDATGNGYVGPAILLGLLGVLVGYQLTHSTSRSADAIRATPAEGVTRTAALCLASLVPGSVALVWVVWMYAAIAAFPIPDSPAIGSADRAAIILAGAVCAVGGPLVGVMVGRWTRFPAAGLMAAVALVGLAVLGEFYQLMAASRFSSLVHLNAPFVLWMDDQNVGNRSILAPGIPWLYLAYITFLCGLAAAAAMLHEATGARRSRLIRVLGILAILAIASLGLAAAADPTRVPV